MKKVSFVMIYSAVFLILSAAVTAATGAIGFVSAWIPLAIAFATVIANVFCVIFIRNAPAVRWFLCSFLNSIALGFAIRAWYIHRGIKNGILTMLAVALAASAVILVYYLISLIPLADMHYAVFFWILSAVLAVCYVVCVFAFRTTYLSTFGYYSVFIWCMVIAMCNDNENAAFYRSVLFASFSVWIIAVIILLFMLNGDSFDFDIIDFSVDSPRKARINSGV